MVKSRSQLHPFNQSINDCIVRWSSSSSRARHRIVSYQQQISFIELPKIEDWISLSSGYHNFILKDTLYREQVGRVWKWVILICVGSKPFLTCLRRFFSIHYWLSTISSPTLTRSSIHMLFFPALEIERNHTWNGSFDSKGRGWWCKGDVEDPFKSWLFSFLPVLVETV